MILKPATAGPRLVDAAVELVPHVIVGARVQFEGGIPEEWRREAITPGVLLHNNARRFFGRGGSGAQQQGHGCPRPQHACAGAMRRAHGLVHGATLWAPWG